MGKLVGKQLDARTIKWKLGLTWGDRVKNPFYLDHFGHRWFAIEFMMRRSWSVPWIIGPGMSEGKSFIWRGGISIFVTDFVSNLRVWLRIPRVPMMRFLK